ncbi:NAD(P)-binding protein [Ceratobasidium sp. AG-I]|nr:NAD(P)-binding protein [Ceratobasidium sp. AG-I]
MSAKVIAIAGGSGYVGKAFTDALLNVKAFEVRVLARESSIDSAPLQDFKKRGATLHVVSYDDEASLVRALEGVDVLISTVAGAAIIPAQIPLIKAAKVAGVKTFFPSEWGSDFDDDHPSPVVQSKKTVLKAANEIGLPVTAVSTGGFPEYCLISQLGYHFDEGKVTVWGEGNAKCTWTTARSIAQWVANVLNIVPIERLQNQHFEIQGDSVSTNEVIALWEKKHGKKLQVEYRPLSEIDDRVKADPADIWAVIIQVWSSGRGELKSLNNDLYPEWKPQTVESIL